MRRVRIGIGGLLAAALAVWLLYPRHLVLEIVEAPSERMVLCAGMAAGEEFVLSFIHSVNRRPVHDTLRADRGHLTIVKSRFDSFGAGMPESSTEQGTLRVAEDGWLEWTTNRALPEVTIRVGRVAGHTLRLKDRALPLRELAEPGAALTLRTRVRSPFMLWRGGCTG